MPLYVDKISAKTINGEEINTITVAIPSEDILNLNSNPVVLVPAQGERKSIVITSLVGSMVYKTTTYTNGLALSITLDVNEQGVFKDGFLGSTSSSIFSGNVFTIDNSIPIPLNTDLIITTPNGNPANGDSDIKIHLTYKIVSL
jgi:hypothetical protein